MIAMDEEELKSLLESLRQGAARITRERLPWIPSYPWKTRDTAGLVASSPGESIELEVINDTPRSLVITHSCFVASKAEVDWVRRSMLLYIAVTNPTIPVKALIFSVSVGAGCVKQSIVILTRFCRSSSREDRLHILDRGRSGNWFESLCFASSVSYRMCAVQ